MAIRIGGGSKTYVSQVHRQGVNDTDKKSAGKSVSFTAGSGGIGTYHMADNPHLYEIQRTNNFEFILMSAADNDFIRPHALNSSSKKTVKGAVLQEVLRMSVSSAFVPHFSQSPIEVKRGNSTLKYAGVPTFNDGSLTLWDYIGADTKALLMAWQNQSYDVTTEKVGLASDYKREAYLHEYTPDYQLVRSWHLYGCWITGLSEGEYSSDGNDKHNITVNITYDKAVLEDPGYINNSR